MVDIKRRGQKRTFAQRTAHWVLERPFGAWGSRMERAISKRSGADMGESGPIGRASGFWRFLGAQLRVNTSIRLVKEDNRKQDSHR